MSSVYSFLVPDATLAITPDSPIPIYRQVVDQIRTHIESDTLKPGDSLPSIRSLATQLGVHFNTIAEAYRQLADEGSIDLTHGRRATVRSSRSIPPAPAVEAERLRHRLRHLVAEMRLKGISAATITREVNIILER